MIEKKGKYTAEQIAEWFLAYNDYQMEANYADPISNMKLNKLLYYAQGCYLAITGNPLFNDRIEGWTHGPVIPAIYHKYKEYGANGIKYDRKYYDNTISREDEKILFDVYDRFAQYSAYGLRNMTHQEKPWIEATENGSVMGRALNIDTMKDYFTKEYIEENE